MTPGHTILTLLGANLDQYPEQINFDLQVDKESFPQKLGPFSMSRVSFRADDLVMPGEVHGFTKTGFSWEMNADVLKRYGLRSQASGIKGQASPIQPVTISGPNRETMMIPEEATHFVWAYPAGDWKQMILCGPINQEQQDANSLVQNFLSVGGFIYFNNDGQFVGATTLGMINSAGGGMRFGKPKKWLREWTRALENSNRFQKVTMTSLWNLGARFFCWVAAGESILGLDGKPLQKQPSVANGGFVYLFHENSTSTDPDDLTLDCYFPLKTMLLADVGLPLGSFKKHVRGSIVA